MEHDDRTQTADPLADMLERLAADGLYRVDAILKETEVERTERVWRTGTSGAPDEGPFIRKYIARESGLGEVYRLLFEAQAAGKRLVHIPRILSCATIADKLVVVMEQAPGETLAACVEAHHGRETHLQLAQQVFPELCDAAHELHSSLEQPIVHRDITPSNVMVGLGGEETVAPTVTLIDFGISRVYKPQADRDTAYLGTRPYTPPEQCGFGQTSVQTDVYALGAVLFFCLTGRAMSNRDRLAGYDDPSIPADLRRVIARACALDAQDRYASAEDLKWAFTACPSVKTAHKADAANARNAASRHDRLTQDPVGKDLADATGASPSPSGFAGNAAEKEAPTNPDAGPAPSSTALAGGRLVSPRHPIACARALAGRLPGAIPTWVCRVWNAFIALTWAVYAAASWFTVAQALPEGTPFWLERCYAAFYVLLFSCMAFVLFDKRRLYARLGLKHDKSVFYQAIRCTLIVLAGFVALFAAHIAYAVLSSQS